MEKGEICFFSAFVVFCSFLCCREYGKIPVLLLVHDLHKQGGWVIHCAGVIRIWIWLKGGEQKELKIVEQAHTSKGMAIPAGLRQARL